MISPKLQKIIIPITLILAIEVAWPTMGVGQLQCHHQYSRWDVEYDNNLFGDNRYANIKGESNWGWRKSGEISGITQG